MHEHDLDSHIAEVHELQAQMRRELDQSKLSSAGSSERNPALKRPAEDCDWNFCDVNDTSESCAHPFI